MFDGKSSILIFSLRSTRLGGVTTLSGWLSNEQASSVQSLNAWVFSAWQTVTANQQFHFEVAICIYSKQNSAPELCILEPWHSFLPQMRQIFNSASVSRKSGFIQAENLPWITPSLLSDSHFEIMKSCFQDHLVLTLINVVCLCLNHLGQNQPVFLLLMFSPCYQHVFHFLHDNWPCYWNTGSR